MIKRFICLISIFVMIPQPISARSSVDNYTILEETKLPCQLEDLSISKYIDGHRFIETIQRKISFREKEILCDTFMYQDMLFVPIRQVSNLLNKEVIYSSVDKTVYILDKTENEFQEETRYEIKNQKQIKEIFLRNISIVYINGEIKEKEAFEVYLCDGQLYIPLKILSEREEIVRIYKDKTIFLCEDFPDGKIIEVFYKEGILENSNGVLSNEILEKILIKVASNISEPIKITQVSGYEILYYGEQAVLVSIEGQYTGGFDFSRRFVFVLE